MNYGPDFTVFFRIWHLVLREKNCSFCVCGVSYYDFADKCVNSVHVIVEMNGFMWCLSGFLCYCAAGQGLEFFRDIADCGVFENPFVLYAVYVGLPDFYRKI